MVLKKQLSLLVLSCALSVNLNTQAQRCDVCTKNGINMPISLAAGTVRTPEFPVKERYYNIDIDAKWLIPSDELKCRMGFEVSPSDNRCKLESLLETKWKVFDGDRVVAEGLDKGRNNSFDADSRSLTKNIGYFKAEGRHRYVVEVTFLKDASILNVTQPHLIVETPGFSF